MFNISGLLNECCEKDLKRLLAEVDGKPTYNLDLIKDQLSLEGTFNRATVVRMIEDAGFFIEVAST